MSNLWWKNPLRVIQPNLQVRDTDKIIPSRLAEQMEAAGSNAIVFNVGGIYGWYPTKVKYHTQNEYLPKDFDLLKEVISECHKRNIKFIARFDFSKAEDSIFQKSPFWFVRDQNGEPQVIGMKRPGEWSLMMSTCINSSYRRDAVAIPVLDEVFDNYDIDGIFYNNPGFIPCWCEVCKSKYRALYQKELPDNPADFEKTWSSVCEHDNITHLYSHIKAKKPEIPVILYYGISGYQILHNENNSDMFCTESQDYLSRGWKEIPKLCKPAITMKVGRAFENKPLPLGIIHSSPGMDWRHTSLPIAEYIAWLSQIPANGGSVWHSITGVPDTIVDKRIMKTVGDFNNRVKKVEESMDGAVSKAEIALLWDGSRTAFSWASALLNKQIQFNIILPEQANFMKISASKLVIVPEEWQLSSETAEAIRQYVQNGGKILYESTTFKNTEPLCDLLGITNELCRSEYLQASYFRFEGENNPAQKSLEDTPLIPHRGTVLYCRPIKTAAALATLVPPFSSVDAVGAPPERASILIEKTDLPLVVHNRFGKGESVFLPFSLSTLVRELKLEEHYTLIENLIDLLLGNERFIKTTSYQGLQVSIFEKDKNLLIHLVNESGQRPLQQTLPLHDIEIEFRVENGLTVTGVKKLIAEESIPFKNTADTVKITVPKLDVWECLLIERA